LRILHILGERGFSGGEHQLRHALTALAAAGHENHLLLQPAARFLEIASAAGWPTTALRMRNGFDLLAARGVRSRLRALDPDLLHLADARAHKLGGLATIAMQRPPTVVTRRIAKRQKSGRYTRWLYGTVADATVTISAAVREALLTVGVAPERIHVIPDGVEASLFRDLRARRAPARAQLGLAPDARVVLCAARLDPLKGQRHLLRAFEAVASRLPGAHLLLAGEGPEEARLAAFIEERHLCGRVCLRGHGDIRDLLAAADVACVPSLKEGLSVFSLEAQAAGLPVVASDVGGLPESVADGQTGLLVPPADERALSDALLRLLPDEALCARLGASGRKRVEERFLAADMTARTVALYERIMRG